MGRGTPEEDLDTYMDNQDQQQAETIQEEQEAFDTAWEIHKFCRLADNILSSDHSETMDIKHQVTDHVLTISLYLSEVESEALSEYVRNHGSKFVTEKMHEEATIL